MAATCGTSTHKLATPQMTEVITDVARRSTWILRTPRRIIQTGRDSTTQLECNISVSSPQDNSPVLIGGIGFPPTRGHSKRLQVFNKRKSTVSEETRYTQKLETSVDRNFPNDWDYASIFSKIIGCEISHGSSSDL